MSVRVVGTSPSAAGQAATVGIGSVTTGAPGSGAIVTNSGTSSAAVFNFTIPAGAAGLGTVTPSTPARVLGTAFQPNTAKACLVSYTLKTQVANPIVIGTSVSTIQLLSDSAATPTTERGRVEATSGVAISVNIVLTTSNTATLTYMVPAGHYVRLVASGSGTHTETIVAQVEEALG